MARTMTMGPQRPVQPAPKMPRKNPVKPQLAAPHGERDFGQLGGFARAGLPADDDHLVRRNGVHDFLALAGNGQGFGEFDF